jgi:hypothetical protein
MAESSTESSKSPELGAKDVMTEILRRASEGRPSSFLFTDRRGVWA